VEESEGGSGNDDTLMAGGGGKKSQKRDDIIYVWPQICPFLEIAGQWNGWQKIKPKLHIFQM